MKIVTTAENLQTYQAYLRIIQIIEKFLQENNYLKLDLPVLSPALIPESYLEIFKTEFRYLDTKDNLFLTPSPELFIKRLLSEGIGDCYSMGKSFRNSEPNSPKHQPEFTMLEWYKIGKDYKYMAQEVLKMLSAISWELFGKNTITYQGKSVSFDKWEEMTVAESFERYAEISPEELFDAEKFMAKAKKKGYVIDEFSFEDVWSQVYSQEIEGNLGTNGFPTVLYDYPIQFASLSKPNSDGKTAQRFEFYIEGIELGNCFSELTDAPLQKKRFIADDRERSRSGKIEHPVDWGFIDSLEKGLPESTGIAIGVERLGMIFTNSNQIEDLKLITVR
ncbi:hypothetical protein COY16_04920 [Candidatus Roizmanbacteria bacterium CG_4_10_14_0_2_um_filter_39_13]|uniref:Aminoacyl-transfer RNA synthetases class-II family profile domain-containing protein n=1 Tax=Candidatus Roizmanbacteria bacterium CG_4_10_14_0_2_um_filter_39_13 TaxID=1974825 RepID=A0A2M7TWN5_9BACT|nr:MAG: hypothetical protein COY16_04920 [Candidatus Roizmanbacteria bacterium CG_4_10_14_0_2_um_filter_39_13]